MVTRDLKKRELFRLKSKLKEKKLRMISINKERIKRVNFIRSKIKKLRKGSGGTINVRRKKIEDLIELKRKILEKFIKENNIIRNDIELLTNLVTNIKNFNKKNKL